MFVIDMVDSFVRGPSELGGKGHALAMMIRDGFPVPRGFVVLCAAQKLFLKENEIEEFISAELVRVVSGEVNLKEGCSRILQCFAKGVLPSEISFELERALASQGASKIAVRSSARGEDSILSSWAGCLESFLGTRTVDLQANLKRCWASLYSERSLSYACLRNSPVTDLAMGVVVQEMARAAVAGVCFTANPVNGNRSELIIEACHGLGDTLVQGAITPDHYVVRKPRLDVINISVSPQKMMSVLGEDGVLNVEVPADRAYRQKLDEKEIKCLSSLCLELERTWKVPLDIEWALDENGRLLILQARPITALPPW